MPSIYPNDGGFVTPLEALRQRAAVVDCPMCEHRARTKPKGSLKNVKWGEWLNHKMLPNLATLQVLQSDDYKKLVHYCKNCNAPLATFKDGVPTIVDENAQARLKLPGHNQGNPPQYELGSSNSVHDHKTATGEAAGMALE